MYKLLDYVEILNDRKSKYKKYCEFCGHSITFYVFEPDRKLCSYCCRYNYRNEKIKFNYLLKEKLSKIS